MFFVATAPSGDEGHIKMFYGWDQPAGSLTPAQLASPAADALSERMLSVQVRALPTQFQKGTIDIEGALRFSLAWVPEEQGAVSVVQRDWCTAGIKAGPKFAGGDTLECGHDGERIVVAPRR